MSTTHVVRTNFETPLGSWMIAGTDKGLSFLAFDSNNADESFARFVQRVGEDVQVSEATGELDEAVRQLREYAAGERSEFDLPLDLHGTDFELSVWAELGRIPFGETRTYGDIARALGDAGASRAIGGANGRNPLPVVVPCHRVVAANGLGGFSGGAGIKERLLSHEGALLFG